MWQKYKNYYRPGMKCDLLHIVQESFDLLFQTEHCELLAAAALGISNITHTVYCLFGLSFLQYCGF